jgi:hypothetical protein
MNSMDSNFPKTDQELLDLLVDGELSESQRRKLLACLEHEPGGWRRCAVAFLEAQSWRRDIGALGQREPKQSISAELASPAAVMPLPRRTSLAGAAGRWLAVAAAFLLALGIGILARDHGRGTVEQAGVAPQVAPETTLADVSKTPNVAERSPSKQSEAQNQNAPWKTVTVSYGGPGESREAIRLPVTECPRIDESWLRNAMPGLPANVADMLRRNGYQVNESPQLLPVPMQDGRQLVVPVNQVELRYVGNRNYQ